MTRRRVAHLSGPTSSLIWKRSPSAMGSGARKRTPSSERLRSSTARAGPPASGRSIAWRGGVGGGVFGGRGNRRVGRGGGAGGGRGAGGGGRPLANPGG